MAPAATATAQDPGGKLLAFDPSRHGFNFANRWDGEIPVDVPVLGRVDLAPTGYGLSGGMSMAAMDSFLANAEVPDFDGAPAAPPSGSRLRSYAHDRQLAAFRAESGLLVRRLAEWTMKSTGTGVLGTGLHELTERQFKQIVVPQIEAGRPVNLCLLRSEAMDLVPLHLELPTVDLFRRNHQVLAIGYRLCPGTAGRNAHWAVDVYDPDLPDRIMSLHLAEPGRAETPREDAQGRPIDDPTSYQDPAGPREYPSFRAFFAVPYAHVRPPWAQPGTEVAVGSIEYPQDPGPDVGMGAGVPAQVLARLEAIERRLLVLEARLQIGANGSGENAPVSDTPAAGNGGAVEAEAENRLGKERVEAMRRDKRFVGGVMVRAPIERTRNAELKGRTGRLQLVYPADTNVEDEVTIFTSGEVDDHLTWGRGAFGAELIPGRYAVVVNKTRLEDLEVTSRDDTRVAMGVLRLNVGASTEWSVFAPGGTEYLAWGRGTRDVGLVPGEYELQINKQRERLAVKGGAVTEY